MPLPGRALSGLSDALDERGREPGAAATTNQSNSDRDQPSSGTVSITVVSVTSARTKKLFAFASVEIDVDGIQIGVHGIRATHVGTEAAAIELPKFRDADGMWRTAITLPEELYTPIAKAVLGELVAHGLTASPTTSPAARDSHNVRHDSADEPTFGHRPGQDKRLPSANVVRRQQP